MASVKPSRGKPRFMICQFVFCQVITIFCHIPIEKEETLPKVHHHEENMFPMKTHSEYLLQRFGFAKTFLGDIYFTIQ